MNLFYLMDYQLKLLLSTRLFVWALGLFVSKCLHLVLSFAYNFTSEITMSNCLHFA